MNLDEIIKALLEAKEHGIDGRTVPITYSSALEEDNFRTITNIIYDSNKIYIKYE